MECKRREVMEKYQKDLRLNSVARDVLFCVLVCCVCFLWVRTAAANLAKREKKFHLKITSQRSHNNAVYQNRCSKDTGSRMCALRSVLVCFAKISRLHSTTPLPLPRPLPRPAPGLQCQ